MNHQQRNVEKYTKYLKTAVFPDDRRSKDLRNFGKFLPDYSPEDTHLRRTSGLLVQTQTNFCLSRYTNVVKFIK